jgi:hypothetical protein
MSLIKYRTAIDCDQLWIVTEEMFSRIQNRDSSLHIKTNYQKEIKYIKLVSYALWIVTRRTLKDTGRKMFLITLDSCQRYMLSRIQYYRDS